MQFNELIQPMSSFMPNKETITEKQLPAAVIMMVIVIIVMLDNNTNDNDNNSSDIYIEGL